MNRPLHSAAREQAHNFFQLLWDDLPTTWHDDIDTVQFEFQLFLAAFDVHRHEQKLRGLALIGEVRKRAERYYQRDLKQVHHTPMDWAYFRFRLELALLKTANATQDELMTCYALHDVLAGLAVRIGPYGQERPTRLPN